MPNPDRRHFLSLAGTAGAGLAAAPLKALAEQRNEVGCLQPGHYDAGKAWSQPRAMTDAEVRKIDVATGKPSP